MSDKKNAAERFEELVKSLEEGAIRPDQFDAKKAILLAEPLSDATDDTKELRQWFQLRKRDLISDAEYQARCELLMNASVKDDTQQNPAPQAPNQSVPPPAPQKKKSVLKSATKKVLLGLALISACAWIGGRASNSGKGKSGSVKQPDYSATQVVDFSAKLKADAQRALDGNEDWRSAFEAKMTQAGAAEKIKPILRDMAHIMSLYSVALKLPATQEYLPVLEQLKEKRDEIKENGMKNHGPLFRYLSESVEDHWNYKAEQNNKNGKPTDVSMDVVQDQIIKSARTFFVHRNAQKMHATR